MKELRPAIYFVLRFVGMYMAGNLCYGFFITSYDPMPDPITIKVTQHSVQLLRISNPAIRLETNAGQPSIAIYDSGRRVINVFEGCNGINVMIVFVSFLIAFKGSLKHTFLFGLFGVAVIYLANLIRVILLYRAALYWETYFYYLHKYVFTGLLYALVMLLWILWIKKIQPHHARI